MSRVLAQVPDDVQLQRSTAMRMRAVGTRLAEVAFALAHESLRAQGAESAVVVPRRESHARKDGLHGQAHRPEAELAERPLGLPAVVSSQAWRSAGTV